MILKPTSWKTLAAIFVLATAFGWSLSHLWVTWFGLSLNVSWLVPAAMVLLAVSLLAWTLMFKARINPERRDVRIDSLVAARTAALALASSRAGSLAAGFYAGVFLTNILNVNFPPAAQRAIFCGITLLASIATVVIAMWLERMCRLPEPPQNSETLVR